MSFELLTGEMHGVHILSWKWFQMFVSQEQQELKFAYNKVRKQLQEKVMEKPLKYIIRINYKKCSLGSHTQQWRSDACIVRTLINWAKFPR